MGKDGRMRRGEVLGDVLSLEWPLGDARTVGTRLGDEAPFSLLPSFPRLEWMSRRSSPRLPGDEGFRGSWMLGFCTEVLCGSGDVACGPRPRLSLKLRLNMCSPLSRLWSPCLPGALDEEARKGGRVLAGERGGGRWKMSLLSSFSFSPLSSLLS